MRKLKPDFFLFTGDTIYADNTIPQEAKLADGSLRENIPNDFLCKNIDQFRHRYRYQFEDAPYARFLSETPVYVVWDDHEIENDWGAEKISKTNPELLKNGVKAFFEYWPVLGPEDKTTPAGRKLYRSFKWGAAEIFILDTRGYRQKGVKYDKDLPPQIDSMLGAEQREWFFDGLSKSRSTWQIVVSSVPLSLPTGSKVDVDGFDGWKADRKLLLFFEDVRATGVTNLLFVTGDVHYPYLMSYDPFKKGTPMFYEVGATPLSAIPLPPAEPDKTLNPTTIWTEGEFAKGPMNFGCIEISADGNLSIKFTNDVGEELFSTVLKATIG